jgi:hypothetical protein
MNWHCQNWKREIHVFLATPTLLLEKIGPAAVFRGASTVLARYPWTRLVPELFHHNFDVSRDPGSLEILSLKSFRMNLDLESVVVVLFSRGFFAMNPRFLKRPTRLFFA